MSARWNPHWFDSMTNEFFRISLINGVLARKIIRLT